MVALVFVTATAWISPRSTSAQLRGPGVQVPVAEGWAQVLSVTNKWLVIQNERGQQFPVALDSINVFFIRWPTDPSRIGPDSLVEAAGLDNGSMQVVTDHVDVYEGAARSLVSPVFVSINNAGQPNRMLDLALGTQVYGSLFPNIAYPLPGPLPSGAPRMYVVGPLASAVPLRIAAGNGTAVTVLPGPDGLTMSQITQGSFSYLRPGDMVHYVATDRLPKSLALTRLVAYKRTPMR
jgi:hypothetical protein